MELKILGPLEVVRDGQAVDLGGAKQRAVLAVLLLNARRVVATDRLADEVWDGSPPPGAATTLRAYVSNLRKALTPDEILHTSGGGYMLDVPDVAIDAARFATLAGEGREALARGDPAGATRCLSEALVLWRGDALQDFAYASFVQSEVARLEEIRVAAVEDLMEARIALGQHSGVTADLEALTAKHPLRERLLRARMLALYGSGRQAEALDAYERARTHLADELGIDPSPDLQELHSSMLRQEVSVATPGSRRTSAGSHVASFVFTDVERSTRMFQALGETEAYAAVLDQQRRLLRDVFEARDCRFVQCVGEEFFAVFDSPSAALRAALDAQLALRAHDWGDGAEVRVRMGVHSGETTLVSGEYVGLSIHLASRICDAAHGGQILVSQLAAELVDANAFGDAELVDLGPHLLKDFDEPVRLHQLVHADLPRTFPPLRTMSALPNNLPPTLSSLIGRDEDIKQIFDLLSNTRLVTLTGVGGVGKSRLALEIGREVLPNFADGVWFCELAPATDIDAIFETVARAMGLKRQLGIRGASCDTVLAALEQRRCLLILDNCEHLLEPVVEILEEVFAGAPGVTVLATSREGLGIDGEHIRPLRSLALPDDDTDPGDADAVRLFVDRAKEHRPDFQIGPHNASAVVDICRRLDGIPLAIELAAARITSMGPLEIAARLDQRFRFLRSGRRTAVERHRTLQATIGWSYALLTPDEQRLFERLSVFAGGFSLHAAETICSEGLETDVVEVLESLVSKSMVLADVTDTETRYLLLETMRQYAQDRLGERGEETAVREAHGDYFLRLTREVNAGLAGTDPQAANDALTREYDNIRAAFTWALTSANIDRAVRMVASLRWYGRVAMPAEAQEWAFPVIDLPGVESHEDAPIVFGLAAYVSWAQSEFDRARQLADRALALAPDPRDPRRADALTALGAILMFEGRNDQAEGLITQILALEENDPITAALWRINLPMNVAYAGDRDRALAMLRQAKSYAVTYPYLHEQALYITCEVLNVGDVDPAAAMAAAQEAHEAAAASRNMFIANASLLTAVSIRGRFFDALEALSGYVSVINGWRLSGNRVQQWLTLLNLVETFARLHLNEEAVVLLAAEEADAHAPGVYGTHRERLDRLIPELESELGPEGCAAARKRGSEMTQDDAVAFALEMINSALAREPTPAH